MTAVAKRLRGISGARNSCRLCIVREGSHSIDAHDDDAVLQLFLDHRHDDRCGQALAGDVAEGEPEAVVVRGG